MINVNVLKLVINVSSYSDLKQIKIKDEQQVMKIYGELLKKGAEGVMLRCPGSPYDAKRSSHLLKVKPHFDDECKIIGYKEGTGKYQGMLGAFLNVS